MSLNTCHPRDIDTASKMLASRRAWQNPSFLNSLSSQSDQPLINSLGHQNCIGEGRSSFRWRHKSITLDAEGTHVVLEFGASPLIFHWEGTSDAPMSFETTGNKGEEQYHGSCNGRSDFLAISASMAMGASSSSAMNTIWWWKPLKHR